MSLQLLKYIETIERIDNAIRRGHTGGRKQLADRLNMNERHLSRYLEVMKSPQLGFPIIYNRRAKTYLYEYRGKAKFGFEKERIEELITI